jgi:hypothetical protein
MEVKVLMVIWAAAIGGPTMDPTLMLLTVSPSETTATLCSAAKAKYEKEGMPFPGVGHRKVHIDCIRPTDPSSLAKSD